LTSGRLKRSKRGERGDEFTGERFEKSPDHSSPVHGSADRDPNLFVSGRDSDVCADRRGDPERREDDARSRLRRVEEETSRSMPGRTSIA